MLNKRRKVNKDEIEVKKSAKNSVEGNVNQPDKREHKISKCGC